MQQHINRSNMHFRQIPYINGIAHYIMVILFVLPLINLKCYSQTKIYGKVINSNSHPISLATILLLKSKDSSLVKGVISSDSGTFTIGQVEAGKYFITCSHADYKQIFSPLIIINGINEFTDLGALLLYPKESELAKVTIITKKPFFEQKTDRLIINVSNSITSAGSTALEVLEKSPGIIVDQNNNILSLNGKEGVVLMINGKINRMPIAAVIQMLAGMNAGSIERIELIPTRRSTSTAKDTSRTHFSRIRSYITHRYH